ncbi:OpgC domain-containing protein [Bryobacter aggregatus]|uniref:OpgC domain-containing protein n=1 Tax=Bryobacter aggregatus TaxID=360054 RepID=UPI0004E21765|nr:OpgC domain-containing protein [Bryobacter aggregatus]
MHAQVELDGGNPIPRTGATRDLTIDFVRGFCLLLMMVNHLADRWLTNYTYRPVGFFCSATVFVYLSGYITGNVYSRYLSSPSSFQLFRKLWHRAALIYLVHVAVSATTVLLTVASPEIVSGLGSDGRLVAAQPFHALLADALLIPSAPLLDILSMYVFLIFLAPLLLRLFHTGWSVIALGTSFTVWAYAQFGYSLLLPPFTGIFDLASWQFLFVIALYVGFRQATHPFRRPEHPKRLNLILFGCLIACFLLRHASFFSIQGLAATIPAWWVDKTKVGPLVIANLLLWVSFLWLVPEPLQRLAKQGRVFVAMGQNSLLVFAWHILLFYLFLSMFPNLGQFSTQSQAIVVCFAAVCLVFPFSLTVNYWFPLHQRSKRNGTQLPSFFFTAS